MNSASQEKQHERATPVQFEALKPDNVKEETGGERLVCAALITVLFISFFFSSVCISAQTVQPSQHQVKTFKARESSEM